MNVKVTKQLRSTYELLATIAQPEVEKEYKLVLELFKQNIEIPGFRKGKAPDSLVIEKVGTDRLHREALQSLLEKNFAAIIKEAGISPISNPSVKVPDFDPKKDLEITITVAVMPEIEVKDYQKIKVKKEQPKKIEEKQVEESVKTLFENWQKTSDKPSDQESGLIYDAKGEVLVKNNVEPDDEFAIKLGAKDLNDLKEKVRQELVAQEEYRVEKEFENKVLDELLKRTKVEIPEPLINEELNRMMMRLNMEIQNVGGTFEDFLKGQGKTTEQLRESWKESAEKNVKLELALGKIAQSENISVTSEEIQNQLKGHDHHDHSEEEKRQEEAYYQHLLKQSKTLSYLKNLSGK